MSYTTHTGLRRSTRLSKDNDIIYNRDSNLENFEDMVNTIVERKFNFRGACSQDRRYPLRDNTRISYSSFFGVNDDEGLEDVEALVDFVELQDINRHSYYLRSRKKVRFSNEL